MKKFAVAIAVFSGFSTQAAANEIIYQSTSQVITRDEGTSTETVFATTAEAANYCGPLPSTKMS